VTQNKRKWSPETTIKTGRNRKASRVGKFKIISMKNLIFLFGLIMVLWLNAFSQVTNEISNVPPLRKGEIILTDGTSISFRQLSVINDTVVFSNSKMGIQKYSATGIYKISKTGNYAASGALLSGLGGLLGGVLGTQGWDEIEELKDQKTSFIVGATVVCAVIGGITGALIKREKVVYKNSTSFSFHPGLGLYQDKVNLMLTCRIRIN